MTTSQPRQPKGQPVGGQFAGKHQSSDEVGSLIQSSPMHLVYRDESGSHHYQPWDDLVDTGTLTDPETGHDMEIVGWEASEPSQAQSEPDNQEAASAQQSDEYVPQTHDYCSHRYCVASAESEHQCPSPIYDRLNVIKELIHGETPRQVFGSGRQRAARSAIGIVNSVKPTDTERLRAALLPSGSREQKKVLAYSRGYKWAFSAYYEYSAQLDS